PEERAINFALLRSMKQAEYSPEDFGHYALNEEDYSHFTSPIRRYPDLTIHRIVGDLAAGRKPKPDNMAELVQLGKHCSRTERRAERAERELTKIKLLRYMATRVGEEMDAFVTGVESFGMFCQGVDIPAEGLIHISALTNDFYTFDQPTRTLTGDRTKRQYRLGDRVRVVIARVDIDRRQLDLRLADKQPPAAAAPSKKQPSPKGRVRQSTSSTSGSQRKTKTSQRKSAGKKSPEKPGKASGRRQGRRKR
ncbi:MAG: RNB domain-containing ribonuclease, partial [Planctomycetaceae bacterium]